MQGNAQAKSYEAQANYAARQAKLVRQKGAYEASRLNDRTKRELDQMRSQYLSSGIALSGSAQEAIADSAVAASLDEQALRFGTEIEAGNLKFQADLARVNAKSAKQAGMVSALSSAAQFASSFAMGGFGGEGGLASMASINRTVIAGPFQQYGY